MSLGVVACCAVVSMCTAFAVRAGDFETDSLKPFAVSRPVPAHLSASARGFDSAPSVTVSSGGRLWIAWHSGGTTEGEDNAVLVATSGDGGKTWSEPLFALDAPGPLRGLDPGLWTDPDGKVWLFYAQVYSYWDGRGGVWAMHPVDPEAADTEWTTPVRLCDGFMKNKPIVDSRNRWLLPVEFMNLDPVKGNLGSLTPMTGETAHPMPEYKASNLFVSTDKGATVSFLGQSSVPTSDRDCTENMVVERTDGTLWMLTRTQYGIGEATSSDGGATWTGTTASAIKNPNSRFFIGRLRSGCLLLVKNGPVNVKTARTQIMAYVSDDDGATWTGGLTLDARENVSYPDAVQDGDGFIHVVHDYDRTTTLQIVHHRFTEADVRAGRLVSTGSRLGDTVAVNPAYAAQTPSGASDENACVRLEYIDSTKGGGQYVDTGFLLRSGDGIDLKLDLLSVDPADYNSSSDDEKITTFALFGVREGSGRAVALIQDVNTTPRQLVFDYGGSDIFSTRCNAGDLTVGSYNVVCDLPQRTIVRPDGTSSSRSAWSSAFACESSAYLFAANFKNVTFTWLRHPQMRFRSLLVRRGTEEHLFLPALRKIDARPGVYDVFNSKFLENKGAGADFCPGPLSQVRIDVEAGDGGQIRVDGGLPTKRYSSVQGLAARSLTLKAEPDAGCVFGGWEVSGAEIADLTAETIVIPTPAESVTATAKFIRPVLVEYIGSTKGGGQYVDTGFVTRGGDVIDLEFDLVSIDPNDYNAVDNPPVTYSMFGSRVGATGAATLLCHDVNTQTPQLFVDYDGANPGVTRLYSGTLSTGRYHVHSDGVHREIIRPDGSSSYADMGVAAFSSSCSAYLFATHVVNVSLPWLPHPCMRFRSLRILRGDEEHWFLPVRTSDGKPCVYDTWNKRLLTNLGSGADFELGPDCASQGTAVTVSCSGDGVACVNGEICGTSFTTNVMFLCPLELSALPANGQTFLRWSCEDEKYDGNRLPAMRIVGNPLQGAVSLTAEFGASVPFSALPYIDSTKDGGQYIDTEFVNQQGDAVDLCFDLLSTDSADYADDPDVFCIFGSRYKSEKYLEVGHCLPKAAEGMFLDYFYYQAGQRLSSPYPVVGTYVVQGNGKKQLITNPNGQTVELAIPSPVAFTAGGSAYLFHSHLVEYANARWRPHPRMRFRSLSIRRGLEEHLFLPALRRSDSKPGVYDFFNSKFLENKGTGADFETKISPFKVSVYGAGSVSVNGEPAVSGLSRHLSFYGVDIMAQAPTGASCAWIGLPVDCYRSASGREVAFMEAEAPNVYLDVFTPSNANLVVPAGESQDVETLAELKSVHVGTPMPGAELANFTVWGSFGVSAADGGYAIVSTEDGNLKRTEIALLNGGRMMLFNDLVVQDIDMPDEKSVLDLNGHTLTIRSLKHKNRKGWSGKVIDSSGGGSVVWKNHGLKIILD